MKQKCDNREQDVTCTSQNEVNDPQHKILWLLIFFPSSTVCEAALTQSCKKCYRNKDELS